MMQLIRNIVKRCRVTLSYPDDKAFPYVQVEFSDKVNNIEVIMPYGLAARIPVNALGHKFILNGDEGDQAAIFNTPSERFKDLEEGEVVVGNPKTRSKTTYHADGRIITSCLDVSTITQSATGSIRLQNAAGYLELKSDGTLDVNGIIFDIHTHGGVTSGGDTTGGPS